MRDVKESSVETPDADEVDEAGRKDARLLSRRRLTFKARLNVIHRRKHPFSMTTNLRSCNHNDWKLGR